MKIKTIVSNTSSHTLSVRKLSSILEHTVGLIGKSKPEAVVLSTRFGIHSFGMQFPIDVIILNAKNEVVALKASLMPYQCFFWNPRYYRVLELPEHTIAQKQIKKFDKIILHIIRTV